jgi:hypothetical protein
LHHLVAPSLAVKKRPIPIFGQYLTEYLEGEMQPVFLRQGLEQGVLLYVHYTHVQEVIRAGHIRNVFYAAVSFRKLLVLLSLRSNLHRHMFAGINHLPFVDRFSRNPGAVWVKMGKWYKANSHPPL